MSHHVRAAAGSWEATLCTGPCPSPLSLGQSHRQGPCPSTCWRRTPLAELTSGKCSGAVRRKGRGCPLLIVCAQEEELQDGGEEPAKGTQKLNRLSVHSLRSLG